MPKSNAKQRTAIMAMGALTFAAAIAALAFGATAAHAAGGDSTTIELTGSIAAKCGFTQAPGVKDVGRLQQGNTTALGPLAFRCNLPNAPMVHLSIKSDNGGLKREGGSELVAYATAWDVPTGGTFVDAGGLTTPRDFALSSGDVATGQTGEFRVQVLGRTDTLIAGTYRDRITYTLSP